MNQNDCRAVAKFVIPEDCGHCHGQHKSPGGRLITFQVGLMPSAFSLAATSHQLHQEQLVLLTLQAPWPLTHHAIILMHGFHTF